MKKDGKKLEKEEKIMENNENKLDEAMLEDVSGGCLSVDDLMNNPTEIYFYQNFSVDYNGRG